MGCFNSETTVELAIQSLQRQSYHNFELLIIDDCSSDKTADIVRRMASSDSRIKFSQNKENKGTYVNRNQALQQAEGEFFTVHDSDDFALPHRLELVVRHLQNHPEHVGVVGYCVRVDEHGRFFFKVAWGGVYPHVAPVTLTLRREKILKEVGYWDSVRFGADTEYWERLKLIYGGKNVPDIKIPIILALFHSDSLTRHPVYGLDINGLQGKSPIRAEYTEAWHTWHAQTATNKEKLYIPFPLMRRPFEVPDQLLSKKSTPAPIISPSQKSTINNIDNIDILAHDVAAANALYRTGKYKEALERYEDIALQPAWGKFLEANIKICRKKIFTKERISITIPAKISPPKLQKTAPPQIANISPVQASKDSSPHILKPSSRFNLLYRQYTGGFSRIAFPEIQNLAFSSDSTPRDRVYAYWLLSKISAQRGEFTTAWQYLSSMRSLVPSKRVLTPELANQWRILASDVLLAMGETKNVEDLLKTWQSENPRAPELCLVRANLLRRQAEATADRRTQWLDALSGCLVKAGFSALSLDGEEICLANLRSHASKVEGTTLPRVSVLMPSFNASATLATALRSVLAQTWTNLEVIIVDDASEDDTFDVASRLALSDARIRVLRNETNSGAYVSRNRALDAATGEFVMVHDSDDWSHPQRIEYQVRDLLDSGERGNYTVAIRVTDALDVVTRRATGLMISMNSSSFMLRTVDARELGGWDNVRVGADSEFIERFEKHFTTKKRLLHKSVPLSFILVRPDSLTQSGATSLSSIHYGARRQYREFFLYWHDSTAAAGGIKGERWFPIPSNILPMRQLDVQLDVLLVTDMVFPGGTTGSNIAMILAAARAGLKIGVLHWPLITHADKYANRKIVAAIASSNAAVIVPGQHITCDVAVVNHPGILMNIPDALPSVTAQTGVVIMNQAPQSRAQNGNTIYDINKVDKNFEQVFNFKPLFAPLSPVIRSIAQVLCPPDRLLEFDWMPMIDAQDWRRTDLIRPKREADGPVLLRHARDHADKWPGSPTEITTAYCANTHVQVRILGGAEKVVELMGHLPSNWSVTPFDGMDVRSFLAQGDVYIFYPHDELIEAFGRAPMEAMAVGLPVLLPHRFKETFGNAALYVTPDEVLSVVDKLMADNLFYQERVLAGFSYIQEHCAYEVFAKRIRKVLERVSRQKMWQQSSAQQLRRA
jgi:glycosyltransferase involved in cell wall biosynthesis